jgi:DNA-binding transcriptional regulator GbsR (MarR family)
MISAVSTVSRSNPPSANAHHPVTGRFPSIEDRFIENWGRLAEGFGMQNSVGRVHAALYLAGGPVGVSEIAADLSMDTDQCAEHLQTLVAFGVVRSSDDDHAPSFEAERDPWSWFMTTVRERARREFSPLLASIRAVNALAHEAKAATHVRADQHRSARMERITHFTHFVDQVASMIEMFSSLGAGPLVATMRLAAKFMPRG